MQLLWPISLQKLNLVHLRAIMKIQCVTDARAINWLIELDRIKSELLEQW